jgi:hypothetical protein
VRNHLELSLTDAVAAGVLIAATATVITLLWHL